MSKRTKQQAKCLSQFSSDSTDTVARHLDYALDRGVSRMKRDFMPLSEVLSGINDRRGERNENRKSITQVENKRQSSRHSAMFAVLTEGILNRPKQ